jgi:hypothetical protein
MQSGNPLMDLIRFFLFFLHAGDSQTTPFHPIIFD